MFGEVVERGRLVGGKGWGETLFGHCGCIFGGRCISHCGWTCRSMRWEAQGLVMFFSKIGFFRSFCQSAPWPTRTDCPALLHPS